MLCQSAICRVYGLATPNPCIKSMGWVTDYVINAIETSVLAWSKIQFFSSIFLIMLYWLWLNILRLSVKEFFKNSKKPLLAEHFKFFTF